jgi:hypothetical protein
MKAKGDKGEKDERGRRKAADRGTLTREGTEIKSEAAGDRIRAV